jgi:osmotically-inducible protein OsmY
VFWLAGLKKIKPMAQVATGLTERRMTMFDDEVRNSVKLELDWEPGLDASHIAVAVKDGAVTLTGYVPSYFQRTLAVTTTERVHGVKTIANELDVNLNVAHTKRDSDIAQSVAHILEWNTLLVGQPIKATVSNGHVTLSGAVDWNYEREEAGYLVGRVLGVKSVSNLVTVKPRVTAEQVEKYIMDALARNAALDARNIHVTTSGRKAVLDGHVHSLSEARAATNAAWQAEGINEVVSHLVVQP